MLIGSFENNLTDKNRLAVPKDFREELKGRLFISRGYEGCLILLDEPRWKKLFVVISKEPILNLSVRDTYRFIVAGAKEVDLDKQGRLVLPEFLKTYAHIDNKVAFLGMNDWIEIWDLDRWYKKLGEISKEASDIADKLLKINNSKA